MAEEKNEIHTANPEVTAPDEAPGGTRPKNDGLEVKDPETVRKAVTGKDAKTSRSTSKAATTSGPTKKGAAKEIEPQHHEDDNFVVSVTVAERGIHRHLVSIAPVGWVGEAPVTLGVEQLDDLKKLLNKVK